ncbi:hypothetical protein PTTG_30067 [Puccinia triticina 1-1 BBBD Race 1]|uniref:DDE_3 domain-containing protein n=1 Tax=Puccinia triticina (isolate 1-1 / race 1 (BBBD)) TaxID=630390 RepID=A0A180G0A2_PUCT1|nr:hypothetical protein PTTG_30067 [Puccinia triticina 1-1 BBBD Race 1]
MAFRPYAPATKIAVVWMALQGISLAEICWLLSLSVSWQSFSRWLHLFEETCCVVKDPDKYKARGRPSTLTNDKCEFIVELVQSEPSLFLAKIREQLCDSSGTLLCVETVHQNLVQRLSITLKKPKTQNTRKSLLRKYTFVQQMEFFPADFLVFTGNSFCDNDLLQLYARSSRGMPAAWFVINQNPLRLSLLAAISMDGLVALTTTAKTFNGRKFEHFLEYDLLPRMNRYPDYNSVLVCDNATVHQGKRVRDLCKAAGVWLLFLPPYCPELNPIKLGFAAIKQNLQASQVLNNAINPEWEIRKVTGELLTAEFSYKVFQHAGYCVPPSPN